MLREAALPRRLARTPEPTATMASAESVAGFDDQGGSSLLPIYRFNALAIHRLAPRGAQIIDLGCGTGRFLAYLALHRPDLKILGIDFAEAMVEVGRRHLARAGLDGRVRLLHGDMREFRRLTPARTDLVTSIFSLHHLTTCDDLLACLREAAQTIENQHSQLWIFDHVRPRRQRTAKDVPEIFTPDASPAFCEDSRNSLSASWSFGELRTALRATFPAGVRAARSRLLPLYQIHWTPPPATENHGQWPGQWIEGAGLSAAVRREAHLLRLLFRRMPGKSGLAATRWRGRGATEEPAP
jgi:SAM-dependent methyltransferase